MSDLNLQVTEHTYRWSEGFVPTNLPDVQEVGEHLKSLSEKHGGGLTPTVVVEDAKKKRSPIHEHFEWDDKVAADKHRLDQASRMLRGLQLVVAVDNETGEERTTRLLLNVDRGSHTYESFIAVMSDAEKRQRVLDRALAEANAWMNRYHELGELSNIFSAIKEAA